MTTTFDALQRILFAYKDKLREDDYMILQQAIDVIHDLQHAENSHRIDSLIERRVSIWEKRFREWRNGRATIVEFLDEEE